MSICSLNIMTEQRTVFFIFSTLVFIQNQPQFSIHTIPFRMHILFSKFMCLHERQVSLPAPWKVTLCMKNSFWYIRNISGFYNELHFLKTIPVYLFQLWNLQSFCDWNDKKWWFYHWKLNLVQSQYIFKN